MPQTKFFLFVRGALNPCNLILVLFFFSAMACSDNQPSFEDNGGDDAGVDVADSTQGLPSTPVNNDLDGDGLLNDRDNCPEVANPNQRDLDDDGIGDLCDDDMDGDGLSNDLDVCDHTDSRGEPDFDGDGYRDDCDSCPLHFNSAQKNRDHDNLGDACETENEAELGKVAYFISFEEGSGDLDLIPAARFDDSGDTLNVSTPFDAYAWRKQDDNFPGDYVIEARVLVRDRNFVASRRAFGFVARRELRSDDDRYDWNGYRMLVDLDAESLVIESADGNGCGGLGLLLCESHLQGAALTDVFPLDQSITLRATAIGSELVVSAGTKGALGAIRVFDDRYSEGGIGIYVEGLEVELQALAVYAPE